MAAETNWGCCLLHTTKTGVQADSEAAGIAIERSRKSYWSGGLIDDRSGIHYEAVSIPLVSWCEGRDEAEERADAQPGFV